MITEQEKLQQLLDYFAKICKTPLRLENGVCALYGEDRQQKAVLELPAGSSSLFIHCEVGESPPADYARIALLMKINFEPGAMRGCWLAMDEYDKLRLCTQWELRALDEQQFTSLLIGFIAITNDVRDAVATVLR